jgi:cytosine/adenosine deaminase-related metal-dependent hydrolase
MIKAIHRAKYVLVEPSVLLQNAAIHISDSGRISRIDTWHGPPANREVEVTDFGPAVIMPGLVNAHTHLELTSFHNQLTQFDTFTDWISQLINRRQTWTKERFLSSAKKGAKLSLASGTTLAGDITSSGVGWDATRGVNLRRVVFEEAIALSPSRADHVMSQLNLLLRRAAPSPLLVHGVSPHAPYSVSPKLYRRLAKVTQSQGKLLATHVAETKEELEFLQNGTGEFRDFLDRIGALPKDWKPPKLLPIPYLDSLGVLSRFCMLIHCNYLDQESIKRLADTQCSVVYCPRSHSFFGHEKHPVRQLLDSGINVALGTDSLASNSSLSMMDEMRFLFKKRKDLKPEEIFRAATHDGAAALNLGNSLGRLRRSYWADLAVFGLPQNLGPRKLIGQILEGAGECIATVIQGQISWQKFSLGKQ